MVGFSIATSVIEALLLAGAMSMDAFISSFAYGTNKIKIPFKSVFVINVVCSTILGVSLLAGTIVRQYIPDWVTGWICFLILFILGMTKVLDGVTKSIVRRYSDLDKKIHFSLCNLKFILCLYADPEQADIDRSKSISPMEAVSLAVALSLDGMAVGFGAAIGEINGVAVFLSSLLTDALAIMLGVYVGNRIAKKININITWISGLVLIIMGFTKLL